ncbi:two component sensor histidine kinase protein [Herbaspirillum rubrisubalbicans M1]|uniref:sensor histidine kinase n=1 Tax=Herbaspirillum rubrisubalbicans TaxID=80842 RepID=UPI00073A0BBB|nr:ATP-binding protein [Herbaspirillum rubrisubalbicans]ALU89334.1 two component sensor histidine kinase protein [Herbaspirillum rubrisubalbicans M1]
MRLLTRGLLIVAIPSLFEVLLLGALFKVQADAEEAERWAAHSAQVVNQAAEVREPMLLESARIRNAILLDQTDPISRADMWAELEVKAGELARLVADNSAQSNAVRGVHEAIARYRTWADSARERMSRGQREELIRQLRDEQGPHRLSEFLYRLDSFVAEERRLGTERTAQLQAARRSQTWLLILAVLGSIVTAALASLAFTRSISRRIAVLITNAQRLADGQTLAARVGGNDEICQLDDALHRSSERLAEASRQALGYRQELEQRARELADVNHDLRQQTQDNEMFIYSVSHDLRSPLVNLQGFSKEITHATRDLLDEVERLHLPEADRNRLRALVEEDIHTSLRFIQNAVTRSAGIIDAMLRLSRAGRVEYQPVMLDMHAIAQRIVSAMNGSIRAKAAQVEIEPDLPPAYGDPTSVEQVLGNLVANAVNYLDPARQGHITIGHVRQADNIAAAPSLVTYFVRDNGLGIPAAYMDKMFIAFQRLHGNAAKGEGIGLALVKRVVERHGGRIWVESVEGQGSCFFVALPARPPVI